MKLLGLTDLTRRKYMGRVRDHNPCGASREHWLLWREWVAARRDQYDAAIREAMVAKREQLRRKANERKRDHGASRRGC